jgi:hypothetical protein
MSIHMDNSINPTAYFVTFGLSLLAGCSQATPSRQRLQPQHPPEVEFCRVAARIHERTSDVDSRITCHAMALKVEWLRRSGVYISPPALMQCGMVYGLDQWLAESVAPAARFYLREHLTVVDSLGSFACKPQNGAVGRRMSEHGSANAIDLQAFRFSSGTTIGIADAWKSRDPRVRIFIRSIHRSACHYFTTVLGPDEDAKHAGHFHLDLANRNFIGSTGTNRICK